jgi:ATP-dependent protease ClpP protease subunit
VEKEAIGGILMEIKEADAACTIYGYTKKKFVVYISGVIEGLPQFLDLLELLDRAEKGTTIRINIHSLGGDLWTTMVLINAIKTTKAVVTTKIVGMAISAAALLFLAGHKKELSHFSILMIHNYSCELDGKNHEIRGRLAFDDKFIMGMYEDTFTGFLTKSEIEKVRDGQDMWLNGADIAKRLK